MAADSTPGMMLWSRRQAAVFRLGSLLLMMYESNSWKTSVGEAGSGRKRQEVDLRLQLTALVKSSLVKSIFRSCPSAHLGSARPASHKSQT